MANYSPIGGYAGPALPGTSEGYFRSTGKDQYPASGYTQQYAVNPTNYQQGTTIAQNYGGGGGGGGQVQGVSAAQALVDSGRAFSINNANDILRSEAAAREAYNAENQSLNTQFDYTKAQLEGQLGTLGTQRDQSLATLDLGVNDVRNQVGTSRANAETNTATQIKQAGSTARNVQSQNRNVLRALGILNSSAAGQILAKPLNQFDEQRAQLNTTLGQRVSELDQFLNQKVAEANNAKNQVISQYTDLYGKIQTDLRFNDRQRNDALKQANAALSQRLQEISLTALNYQNQVELQKQQFAAGLASMNNYQNPTYNQNALAALGLVNPQQTNQTAAIFNPVLPQKKNTLGGL